MAQEKISKLRPGNIAPDFEANTTQGKIKFYDHIQNNWAILFAFPDDFTPVATTELVMFAQMQVEMANRGVKLIALTTRNTPVNKAGTEYRPHEDWVKDVNEIGNLNIEFPVIDDEDGSISRLYHILEEEDTENLTTDGAAEGLAFESRSAFIIDPKHRIRLIFNYPAAVGMNTAEVLRTVDCLQTAAIADVRTPANWVPGADVIVPLKFKEAQAKQKFPDFRAVKPYLRFTPLPVAETNIPKTDDTSEKKALEFMSLDN